MKKSFLLTVFFLISIFCVSAGKYSEKVYLWKNVKGMETQIRDTILYVVPAKSDSNSENSSDSKLKPAVIICPGGSYHHLGMKHEGFASAEWFSSIGINAFVLQYRVAYNEHHFPAQLEDIQMAVLYVRSNAEKYGIDRNKVGAIGYSAGGHLVTMAGEFSGKNQLEKLGVKTEESLRPDFVMPVYPVVSMQDDIAHKWSRRSLLGHKFKSPDAEKGWALNNFWGHKYSQSLKDAFSMENPENIPDDMPPVFLLACIDDPVVMYENSVRLDKSLTERSVQHVFVTYETGGHGFGMKPDSEIMVNHRWNDEKLLPWLKSIKILGNENE